MSGTKPANLSTTSKDFPQELLDQLNYVISDLYSWISELRGSDGFKHDANSSTSYITAEDVTAVNLAANGGIGTQSDQVASGDKGVTNGSNHDHVGGDGAAITEAAITLADNTTLDVSTSKHGLVPRAPSDSAKFLRGDASFAVPAHGSLSGNVPTWIEVSSFDNSWVNYGGGSFGNAAYCKDAHGFVHLRGMIKSGTVGATAFTLPAGYAAPSYSLLFSVISNNDIGRLDIGTDGAVKPETPCSNVYVSLDGVSFYAG